MTALRPLDILMGVSVAVIWGMGFVFAKAAINHFPPILLMALRFAVTALALVWFAKPPFGAMWQLFAIAWVSAAVQYSLTFTGLQAVDAGIGALIIQLEVPFLVLLGALVLKERPGLRKWIGIVLAFVGAALIAGEPKLHSAWLAIVLLAGGALTWAIGQMMVRQLQGVDAMTTLAWVAVFATPQLTAWSLVFESNHVEAIRSAGLVVWSAVIYLGLVMTALGYGMWYTLVRKHPISQIAPFLLLLPVTSVIGGIVFLGERLHFLAAIGGAIVVAGVAFILIERIPVPRAVRKPIK